MIDKEKTIGELEARREDLDAIDQASLRLADRLYRKPEKPKRDARGRWLPKESGNILGKRRTREVRPLSPAHLRREFLAAMEAPRTVMTPEGPVSRTVNSIILESIMTKAAKGHAPHQRWVMARQEAMVTEMLLKDRDLAERLKRLEDLVVRLTRDGGRLTPELLDEVEKLRRRSREL